MEEYLEDLITGKEKSHRCSGYPLPNTHEMRDYVLYIGKGFYSYACPECGFGQGGSLSEEACERLRKIQEGRDAK